VGQADFTLQSQINKREPRTFGEVSLQQQDQQRGFSLDASLHIEKFSQLFSMMWDLHCQYGPEEQEFEYFQNQWEKLKLTREETQGKYRITVRGNDQNTNPQTRLQKAQAIMMGATNPVLLNTGVVGPEQIANAVKLYYETLDVENAEMYYVQKPQPPQPDTMNEIMKIDFDSLADGEKAQVVQKMGMQPDVQGRQLMNQAAMVDKQTEYELERRALDAKEKQAAATRVKAASGAVKR
jgi:hypothetical protein